MTVDFVQNSAGGDTQAVPVSLDAPSLSARNFAGRFNALAPQTRRIVSSILPKFLSDLYNKFSYKDLVAALRKRLKEEQDEKEGKEGKDKVESPWLMGGREPLECKILYLIKKNRVKKAVQMIQKALDKAKTPKGTMKILNIASLAVVEMKYLGWMKDALELESTVLIAEVCSGRDFFKMPRDIMHDYSLMTKDCNLRSRREYTVSDAFKLLRAMGVISANPPRVSEEEYAQIEAYGDRTYMKDVADMPEGAADAVLDVIAEHEVDEIEARVSEPVNDNAAPETAEPKVDVKTQVDPTQAAIVAQTAITSSSEAVNDNDSASIERAPEAEKSQAIGHESVLTQEEALDEDGFSLQDILEAAGVESTQAYEAPEAPAFLETEFSARVQDMITQGDAEDAVRLIGNEMEEGILSKAFVEGVAREALSLIEETHAQETGLIDALERLLGLSTSSRQDMAVSL